MLKDLIEKMAKEIVMDHLRKETIDERMDLANRCYPPHEEEPKYVDPFGEKEIEKALKPQPQEELENFITSLSDDEKAELMALMWLGRDGGQWKDLLSHAKSDIEDAAMYMAEKTPLTTYLKKGLERAKVAKLI